MTLFAIAGASLLPVDQASFAKLGLRERVDIQRMLSTAISVIDPDLLVIAEEFGSWEDSRRRIDLLAIDRDARLVVVELKRDDEGGHMDLQALRYAAMVSTMTLEHAVDTFAEFLAARGERPESAEQRILSFLDWEEPDEERFASDVRLVLVSQDFSREVTTTVLFLNDRGMDIRCFRMRPYCHGPQVLLDVQQIIPLPEASEYTVNLRRKRQRQQAARSSDGRDLTKFDVVVDGELLRALPKRRAIFRVVKALVASGVPLSSLREQIGQVRSNAFLQLAGDLDARAFAAAYELQCQRSGSRAELRRWFADDHELFRDGENTCALTKMWGLQTEPLMQSMLERYPHVGLSVQPTSP